LAIKTVLISGISKKSHLADVRGEPRVLVVVLHQLLLGDEALVAHQALVRPDVQLAFHVQAQAGQAVESLAAQGALQRMGFGVLNVVLALGKLVWYQADRTLVPAPQNFM
jgi:hypothetical protein